MPNHVDDYIKTPWVDDAAPDIDAVSLLNIENGIERVTIAVQGLQTSPYVLPPASESTLGGVKVWVVDNGDGTFTGNISST